MELEEAKTIIDNMYQKKMSEREEKTEQGTTIHLDIEINFTDVEKASIRLLREVIKLEQLNDKSKKVENFIEKQRRCYERKISKIIEIKKERNLKDLERRVLKYYIGKKDECEKILDKFE